jgi:hypothetical protein
LEFGVWCLVSRGAAELQAVPVTFAANETKDVAFMT